MILKSSNPSTPSISVAGRSSPAKEKRQKLAQNGGGTATFGAVPSRSMSMSMDQLRLTQGNAPGNMGHVARKMEAIREMSYNAMQKLDQSSGPKEQNFASANTIAAKQQQLSMPDLLSKKIKIEKSVAPLIDEFFQSKHGNDGMNIKLASVYNASAQNLNHDARINADPEKSKKGRQTSQNPKRKRISTISWAPKPKQKNRAVPLEKSSAPAADTSLDSTEQLFIKESAIFERLMRTGGSEMFKTQHDGSPQNFAQIESQFRMSTQSKQGAGQLNQSSQPASSNTSRDRTLFPQSTQQGVTVFRATTGIADQVEKAKDVQGKDLAAATNSICDESVQTVLIDPKTIESTWVISRPPVEESTSTRPSQLIREEVPERDDSNETTSEDTPVEMAELTAVKAETGISTLQKQREEGDYRMVKIEDQDVKQDKSQVADYEKWLNPVKTTINRSKSNSVMVENSQWGMLPNGTCTSKADRIMAIYRERKKSTSSFSQVKFKQTPMSKTGDQLVLHPNGKTRNGGWRATSTLVMEHNSQAEKLKEAESDGFQQQQSSVGGDDQRLQTYENQPNSRDMHIQPQELFRKKQSLRRRRNLSQSKSNKVLLMNSFPAGRQFVNRLEHIEERQVSKEQASYLQDLKNLTQEAIAVQKKLQSETPENRFTKTKLIRSNKFNGDLQEDNKLEQKQILNQENPTNADMQGHYEEYLAELQTLDLPKPNLQQQNKKQKKQIKQYGSEGSSEFNLSQMIDFQNASEAVKAQASQQQLWKQLMKNSNTQIQLKQNISANLPWNKSKTVKQEKKEIIKTKKPKVFSSRKTKDNAGNLEAILRSTQSSQMLPKLAAQATQPPYYLMDEDEQILLKSRLAKKCPPRRNMKNLSSHHEKSSTIVPLLPDSSKLTLLPHAINPNQLKAFRHAKTKLEMSSGDKLRQHRRQFNLREHSKSLAKLYRLQDCSNSPPSQQSEKDDSIEKSNSFTRKKQEVFKQIKLIIEPAVLGDDELNDGDVGINKQETLAKDSLRNIQNSTTTQIKLNRGQDLLNPDKKKATGGGVIVKRQRQNDLSPPKIGKDIIIQNKQELELRGAKSTTILNNHGIMVDGVSKLNKYSKTKQDRDFAELQILLEQQIKKTENLKQKLVKVSRLDQDDTTHSSLKEQELQSTVKAGSTFYANWSPYNQHQQQRQCQQQQQQIAGGTMDQLTQQQDQKRQTFSNLQEQVSRNGALGSYEVHLKPQQMTSAALGDGRKSRALVSSHSHAGRMTAKNLYTSSQNGDKKAELQPRVVAGVKLNTPMKLIDDVECNCNTNNKIKNGGRRQATGSKKKRTATSSPKISRKQQQQSTLSNANASPPHLRESQYQRGATAYMKINHNQSESNATSGSVARINNKKVVQNVALDKLKIVAINSLHKMNKNTKDTSSQKIFKNSDDVDKQKKRFNLVMKQARFGNRIQTADNHYNHHLQHLQSLQQINESKQYLNEHRQQSLMVLGSSKQDSRQLGQASLQEFMNEEEKKSTIAAAVRRGFNRNQSQKVVTIGVMKDYKKSFPQLTGQQAYSQINFKNPSPSSKGVYQQNSDMIFQLTPSQTPLHKPQQLPQKSEPSVKIHKYSIDQEMMQKNNQNHLPQDHSQKILHTEGSGLLIKSVSTQLLLVGKTKSSGVSDFTLMHSVTEEMQTQQNVQQLHSIKQEEDISIKSPPTALLNSAMNSKENNLLPSAPADIDENVADQSSILGISNQIPAVVYYTQDASSVSPQTAQMNNKALQRSDKSFPQMPVPKIRQFQPVRNTSYKNLPPANEKDKELELQIQAMGVKKKSTYKVIEKPTVKKSQSKLNMNNENTVIDKQQQMAVTRNYDSFKITTKGTHEQRLLALNQDFDGVILDSRVQHDQQNCQTANQALNNNNYNTNYTHQQNNSDTLEQLQMRLTPNTFGQGGNSQTNSNRKKKQLKIQLLQKKGNFQEESGDISALDSPYDFLQKKSSQTPKEQESALIKGKSSRSAYNSISQRSLHTQSFDERSVQAYGAANSDQVSRQPIEKRSEDTEKIEYSNRSQNGKPIKFKNDGQVQLARSSEQSRKEEERTSSQVAEQQSSSFVPTQNFTRQHSTMQIEFSNGRTEKTSIVALSDDQIDK